MTQILDIYNNGHDNKVTVQTIPIELANIIGLDQAIVIQQIQYWIKKCGKSLDSTDGLWIYNSLENWHNQFAYWSLSKLRRVIASLEEKKLILSRKVNAKKWNHTKWYTVNFSMLSSLLKPVKKKVKKLFSKSTDRSVQNEHINNSKTENNYTKKNPSLSPQERGEENKDDLDLFLDEWRKNVSSLETHAFTLKRKRKYTRALKNHFNNDIKVWKDYLHDIKRSNFLMGRVKGFAATLDWALKEENILKVREGRYNNTLEKDAPSTEKIDIEIVSRENQNSINEYSGNVKAILLKLKERLGEYIYYSWFKDACFNQKNTNFLIEASSKFKKNYIADNYDRDIRKIVNVCHERYKVLYV